MRGGSRRTPGCGGSRCPGERSQAGRPAWVTHTHPHTLTLLGPGQAGPCVGLKSPALASQVPHLTGARTHCGHGHSLRGRTKGAVGGLTRSGSKRNSSLCFSWRKSSRQRDAGFGSEGTKLLL